MSWKALEHVRTLQGVSVTVKGVLFALAYRDSDEHQGSWPRIKLLAADAGVSVRTAQVSLRWAEQHGIIRIIPQKREDGSATSNKYQFVALTPPADSAPPPALAAPLEKNIEKRDDDTAAIKPSEVFAALQSTEGPVYVDVSHPEHYDKGFHGDLSDFNAEELNAYISKMDAVRRKHARHFSKISAPAEIAPLVVRPRDLRMLFSLAHQTHNWTAGDLWDTAPWGGISSDGHDILVLAAERAAK